MRTLCLTGRGPTALEQWHPLMFKASSQVLVATRRQPQLPGWQRLASISLPLAVLKVVCEYEKDVFISQDLNNG